MQVRLPQQATSLGQEILNRKDFAYDILGFVGRDPCRVGETLLNPKIIGTYDQLCDIAGRHVPTKVVVAIDDRRNGFPIDELLECKMRGSP